MVSSKRPRRVKDLAVRDVISIQPDDPLGEAVRLLVEHRVNAMPVVDNRGRCKGIFSSTDLVRVFHRASSGSLADDSGVTRSVLERLTVADVMTSDVMTLTPEDPILDAAREMVRSRIHRLVVVDPGQRVIGILSTLDLLEAFSAET